MEEAFHLYLASASPRRRELLQQAGLRFRLLAAGVDESRRAGEAPEDYVQRLALDKARAGLAQLTAADTHPVLGADTLVLCAGQVLGKPRDAAQARAMLSLLSGRSHSVLTAVALCRRGWQATALSRSTVSFRPLSPEEIAAYWTSGEPRDKAGAYAIQGRAALFVTALSGSYSGVMGLPLYETGQLLEQAGLALPTLLAEAAA